MALTSGDLPYVSVTGFGTNPEQRSQVEFTLTDDTGAVTAELVADAVRQVLFDSGVIASVTAVRRAVVETEV